MTRLRVTGTLRDHKPVRERIRDWLWISAAVLVVLGAMYGAARR